MQTQGQTRTATLSLAGTGEGLRYQTTRLHKTKPWRAKRGRRSGRHVDPAPHWIKARRLWGSYAGTTGQHLGSRDLAVALPAVAAPLLRPAGARLVPNAPVGEHRRGAAPRGELAVQVLACAR